MDPEPPTDSELAGLLDAERGSQAARERTNQRWLRQQALEEAQLAGVLLSAAEQHATVTIRSSSGRSYTGLVALVAGDFCGLRTANAEVYIRLDAMTVVQPDRSLQALPAGDDRTGPLGTTLREFLADLAGDRPDLGFVCTGQPHAVPGRLVAVGIDVASVEMDQRRTVAYVALGSVTEVSLRASG